MSWCPWDKVKNENQIYMKLFREITGYLLGGVVFVVLMPLVLWLLSGRPEFFPAKMYLYIGAALQDMFRIAAIVLMVAGLSLSVWSIVYMRRKGKGNPMDAFNHEVAPRTRHLMTGGPYRLSRNPMLSGTFLYLLGWSVWFDTWQAFVCFILFVVVMLLQVRSEEKRLRRDFGEEYEAYCRTTGRFFPKRKVLSAYIRQYRNRFWFKMTISVISILLIVLSVWMNINYNAGFCVFVPWAMALQLLSFVNMVTFPWLERTRLWRANALMCGVSTGVYIYWVLFAGFWVLLYPASLWFLFLLFRHFIIHPEVERSRGWYWSGIIICFVFAIVSVGLYSSAANKVRQGEYDTRNPMTERVLGMHFRYHTSFCIYDGWRPPLHDPAMVIGTRLGGGDPLHDMSLEERLALYHKVFPNNPVKAPCACCRESRGYFTDELWETLERTDSLAFSE